MLYYGGYFFGEVDTMGVQTVFVNVLIMLFYMACGFVLVKTKKADPDHARSFSGLLLYVCSPCLILSAFQSMEYAPADFARAGQFFGVSLMTQLLFIGILYLILHRRYKISKYRILTVGAVLGNVGFFGLPLVTGLFPDQPIVACYSTMYITSMNFLVFTLGVFLITQKKQYISFRAAILNPTTLSVAVAIPLYLLRVRFPAPMADTVSLLGRMSTPLCMVILGKRLASMHLKTVFAQPFAYAVCALKLVVYPLFAFLCVKFLPFFDDTFKICLYVLSAAPSGAIILSLAELHGCEQRLSANVVLLTTLFSLLTLPLMLLLVV